MKITHEQDCSGRRSAGFTLIELLIVVAIIGLLASVAIPALQRSLLRSQVARLANDSRELHDGFMKYHIDNAIFPSTSTPVDRAFNLRTLEPLVSKGHIKAASAIKGMLLGRKVTAYDSPNVGGSDTEFWAVLTLKSYPAVQVVVANTTMFPNFEGQSIDGCYFILADKLLPIDANILDLLAG